MKKPYIAKDKEDPGRIEPGEPIVETRTISNRELIIRICEKLGVPTDE